MRDGPARVELAGSACARGASACANPAPDVPHGFRVRPRRAPDFGGCCAVPDSVTRRRIRTGSTGARAVRSRAPADDLIRPRAFVPVASPLGRVVRAPGCSAIRVEGRPDETAREAAKVCVRVAAAPLQARRPRPPGRAVPRDAPGNCAIARIQRTRPPRGGYAASMAFSRCSHSSSSTISKRTILPRMAGTNSAQSVFFACREQRSNTERL